MEAGENPLFKARDVALTDAKDVGNLLLRQGLLSAEAEAQLPDALLTRRKMA